MKEHIKNLFNLYKQQCNIIEGINKTISSKKIRRPNFPEVISENIVLFYLESQTQRSTYTWNTKNGDLSKIYNNKSYKIEIKCSSSDGPLSFSPFSNFNELYCVDATNFINNHIKIYKINGDINTLQVNKNETFLDQCKQKRRPRISLNLILKQLSHELIFDDCIYSLLN